MWHAKRMKFMFFKWNASTPGVYVTRYAHEIHVFFTRKWFFLDNFLFEWVSCFLNKMHQPRGVYVTRNAHEKHENQVKRINPGGLRDTLFTWKTWIFSKMHQPRGVYVTRFARNFHEFFYKEVIFLSEFF